MVRRLHWFTNRSATDSLRHAYRWLVAKVRLITIEPVGYLFVMASIIQATVTPNLFLRKTCLVNYNLSASLCDTSPHHNHSVPLYHPDGETARSVSLTTLLHRYVSVLNIYSALIENIPSIFFVLLLGPWSDRYGRKPLMVIPIIGQMLSTLLYVINYLVDSWPAEYLLLANVPVGVMGGIVTIVMAMNSYLVDVTDEETRTARLSLLAGLSLASGFPVAHLMSYYLYQYGGYLAIWGATFGLYIVNLVYLTCYVVDSRGITKIRPIAAVGEDTVPKKDDVRDEAATCASVIKNFWQCFTVTFRSRHGYQRARVVLLFACLCLNLFSSGQHGLVYLYTRKQFGWDVPEYAKYTSLVGTITEIGSLGVLPVLSGFLRVSDGAVGLVSVVAHIGANVTIAFAVSPLMMNLSSIGLVLVSGIMVVIRSQLSKIVGPNELSHVFAVAASLESCIPLMASPTLNLLYRATLDYLPGCVFLLDASLEFISVIILVTVLYLQGEKKAESQSKAVINPSIVSQTVTVTTARRLHIVND